MGTAAPAEASLVLATGIHVALGGREVLAGVDVAVADNQGRRVSRCGFGFILTPLASAALLLAGLAVVVVDAVFGFVGFVGFADTAVVEDVFLVALLGEVVLGDFAADLLNTLLAGR